MTRWEPVVTTLRLPKSALQVLVIKSHRKCRTSLLRLIFSPPRISRSFFPSTRSLLREKSQMKIVPLATSIRHSSTVSIVLSSKTMLTTASSSLNVNLTSRLAWSTPSDFLRIQRSTELSWTRSTQWAQCMQDVPSSLKKRRRKRRARQHHRSSFLNCPLPRNKWLDSIMWMLISNRLQANFSLSTR